MTTEEGERRALSLRRLDRAKQHLKAARDLLAADGFPDSVSRSYYAIFQAARALLAIEGLESRKHSGVVSLFNRHFVKPGRGRIARRMLRREKPTSRRSRCLRLRALPEGRTSPGLSAA